MSHGLQTWSSPADVDIGVIYTHEDHLMDPLLNSLRDSGDQLDMRLILIDNASQRGADRWQSVFSNTLVVRNQNRLGYAANLNRILQNSDAPYILLLNTDMYFNPDMQCITRMVRFMDAHWDCGIAGCGLYHPDEAFAYPARRFQSLKTIAARRLGLSGFWPEELNDYLYRHESPKSIFECEWLSGCFLMVRRLAFEDIGYLDDQFGKYFEDVDFCLRAAMHGWKIMFNGETYAYHLEQRSSHRVFSVDAVRHIRAYARWLRKWGLNPRNHLPVPIPDEIRRAA